MYEATGYQILTSKIMNPYFADHMFDINER